MTYKTPGVYIKEISLLPPSVAQVETAIPAFIGYTEKALDEQDNDVSASLPYSKRITSLLEYERHFGKKISQQITLSTDDNGPAAVSITPDNYLMYHGLQIFFANGGGPCYIISIGIQEAGGVIDPALLLNGGLNTLKKKDEPTLILFPDAVNISTASDHFEILKQSLLQCQTLGDRFLIMDVHNGENAGDTEYTAFRTGIGANNLKYGSAYTPYLKTSLGYYYHNGTVQIDSFSTANLNLLALAIAQALYEEAVAEEAIAANAVAGDESIANAAAMQSAKAAISVAQFVSQVFSLSGSMAPVAPNDPATAVSEANIALAAAVVPPPDLTAAKAAASDALAAALKARNTLLLPLGLAEAQISGAIAEFSSNTTSTQINLNALAIAQELYEEAETQKSLADLASTPVAGIAAGQLAALAAISLAKIVVQAFILSGSTAPIPPDAPANALADAEAALAAAFAPPADLTAAQAVAGDALAAALIARNTFLTPLQIVDTQIPDVIHATSNGRNYAEIKAFVLAHELYEEAQVQKGIADASVVGEEAIAVAAAKRSAQAAISAVETVSQAFVLSGSTLPGAPDDPATALADAKAAMTSANAAENAAAPVSDAQSAAGLAVGAALKARDTLITPLGITQPEIPSFVAFFSNEFDSKVKELLARQTMTMPPSSAMAGIYAQVDRTRGVWKAPANVSVNMVSAPTVKITHAEQESLNIHPTGKSINAIRTFAGKGIMVWGARTLAGNDNEWKYISVRRFFNMAEESIKKATEQFVFEPNDANTWVKVRAMIENFLILQWRAGALAGATQEEAFYVKVKLGETMTSLDILEGRMNVEIGMAVVRPAEFIILKFSHKMQES